VPLNNGTPDYPDGDNIGVATTWSPPSAFENFPLSTISAVFDAIRKGIEDGELFTLTRNSERWLGDAIVKLAEKTEQMAAAIIAVWHKNEVLIERKYRSKKQRKDILGVTLNEAKATEILAPFRASNFDKE
jgi:hypothetical protein